MTKRALNHLPGAAACVLLTAIVQAQPEDPLAAVRAEFTAAYRSALVGEQAVADSERLRSYALFDYLEAARIEHGLTTAAGAPGESDRAAEAFIATHGEEPTAKAVESSWLVSLARRGLAAEFIARFNPAAASTALTCQYLSARIELGPTRALADAVKERWLSGAQQPPQCESVFEWGRSNGVIDEDAIAARVVLLLEEGQAAFARVIARQLSPARAEPLVRWAELLQNPAGGFDALLSNPADRVDDQALLDAWGRFSRNEPAAAAGVIASLLSALKPDPAVASELHRLLALGLAWDRRGEALDHFAAVNRENFDDYTREWQARAALWAGEWPTAMDAVDAMSPERRNESAWRYWAGRAQTELGNAAAGRTAYEAVLDDDNFYSAIAAARLGRRHAPAHMPLAVDAGTVESIAELPALVRARELHAIGMETEARREWNVGYAELTDRQKLASIRLAASWQWYEIAVLTASRNDVYFDYELLYPRRYAEYVPAAAEQTAFDQNLLYALMRQESLFAPGAVSTAGAIGLMQLRLETARRAAHRWAIDPPSRAALFDPRTNITLGAAQLRNLIDEFDGQVMPALAGYNAGYNAAARWLPPTQIDADVWVENIPYNETRAYVRRVLWHSMVYAWLESGQPQDARSWLEPIRRP